MKFQVCNSTNSTENSHEGYRNGLSETALEFENCIQQLFLLTMCLPACLWAQITRTLFNYTITAQILCAKCDGYQFQRSILQFPALWKKLSCCVHVHHTLSIKYTLRCCTKRKWLHALGDKPFPEVGTNQVESMTT